MAFLLLHNYTDFIVWFMEFGMCGCGVGVWVLVGGWIVGGVW